MQFMVQCLQACTFHRKMNLSSAAKLVSYRHYGAKLWDIPLSQCFVRIKTPATALLWSVGIHNNAQTSGNNHRDHITHQPIQSSSSTLPPTQTLSQIIWRRRLPKPCYVYAPWQLSDRVETESTLYFEPKTCDSTILHESLCSFAARWFIFPRCVLISAVVYLFISALPLACVLMQQRTRQQSCHTQWFNAMRTRV